MYFFYEDQIENQFDYELGKEHGSILFQLSNEILSLKAKFPKIAERHVSMWETNSNVSRFYDRATPCC